MTPIEDELEALFGALGASQTNYAVIQANVDHMKQALRDSDTPEKVKTVLRAAVKKGEQALVSKPPEVDQTQAIQALLERKAFFGTLPKDRNDKLLSLGEKFKTKELK